MKPEEPGTAGAVFFLSVLKLPSVAAADSVEKVFLQKNQRNVEKPLQAMVESLRSTSSTGNNRRHICFQSTGDDLIKQFQVNGMNRRNKRSKLS